VVPRAVISVGAGRRHTCAADRLKSLWCWGSNGSGELGKDVEQASRPLETSAGAWIEVVAGGLDAGHSCAIHEARSLWCWGSNALGQLGLGPNEPDQTSPTRVSTDAWQHIDAGDGFTCGIRQGGTLLCWGTNADGRLGYEAQSATPAPVSTDTDWESLAVGDAHGCALKFDGTLWCWGSNRYGQLGRDVGPGNRPNLVPNETTFRAVSAGGRHTCAVGVNGGLYCWGDNTQGQLGFPASSGAREPARVAGGLVWLSVSAGDSHTCAIDRADALYCWGANGTGQLGVESRASVSDAPAPVSSSERWALVSAGHSHTCAVSRIGATWCWGAGESFQHGLGVDSTVWTPGLLSWE
jgi:alpha-tubulin suppressor-like RCC1 family protein